jgi:undecaprenyl phosphate-alpha-L-ara4FN deformylase
MTKYFFIRVDVESERGIEEGLPKLLDLFMKEKIKGSFYLVMGGEANIFEILKNRTKMNFSGERKIKIWSMWDKIRMVLFPSDFVGKNEKLLKRIIDEGHELGIHGWKHRIWTRGGKYFDYENQIQKSIKRYKEIFKKNPISFSAPGFRNDLEITRELAKNGILYESDFPGEDISNNGRIKNVPITINGKNKMPFIEYWVGEGKNDAQILEIFKHEKVDKKIVSFYIHDMFEGRFKIELLKKMIRLLKKDNFKNKRVVDFK